MHALDNVAAEVAALIPHESARAVALYETFLAACELKSEELDDSDGNFGIFVNELYCGWIKARQAGAFSPEATADRLLQWMDQDPWGYCHELEKDAVKVFDRANLDAFAKQVRARYELARREAAAKNAERHPAFVIRQWADVLRTLHVAQGDLDSYLSLVEEAGVTAKDCLVIATMLRSDGKAENALTWTERGLELDKRDRASMSGYELKPLQRALLAELGRGQEALEDCWNEYREHPSQHDYVALMNYVPGSERSEWQERALEVLKTASLWTALEVLLEAEEVESLAERVRQASDHDWADLSHYSTEPVAKKLEETRPDQAARLWRAQGFRIVNATKSRYYDAALSNFERAQQCFYRADLEDAWLQTVAQVRAAHRRKTSFIPGFERMVAGRGSSQAPSFLERARARWQQREEG